MFDATIVAKVCIVTGESAVSMCLVFALDTYDTQRVPQLV